MKQQLECIKCGKKIKPGDGHYKSPDGTFCPQCWKEHAERKAQWRQSIGGGEQPS